MSKTKRVCSVVLMLCLLLGVLVMQVSARTELEPIEASGGVNTYFASEDEYYEEVEPNDDLYGANLIAHDYVVAGTLSGDDQDVYIFEMGAYSYVNIYAAATTDTLAYALINCETGEVLTENVYLGFDTENGVHTFNLNYQGNGAGMAPGVYCLVFLDQNYADSEYAFYAEIPGNLTCLHVYDSGAVTKELTCDQSGEVTYTCTRCGGTYVETVLAPGHGFSGDVCTVCGIGRNAVIAEGLHDFGPVKWKITADGTLYVSGQRSLQSKTEFEWDGYAHLITGAVIEDGITNVPNRMLDDYPNLEWVSIGSNVEYIGEAAFAGSEKLSSITIPASVTEIKPFAFSYCTGLEEIQFGEDSNLTKLGRYAFQYSGLKKVTLPAGVETIDEYTYANCASLEEAILPEGIVNVEWYAFENCKALKTVSLPSTLDSGFTGGAFAGCTAIETLYVNCDAGFGQQMSYEESLKTVIFGAQVTVVSGGSFSGCINLTEVTLSESVAKIERDAFSGCTSLTEIVLPENMTEIGSVAFSGSGLISVDIPDEVAVLEIGAFRDCKALKEVKLGKNTETISGCAFSGCTALEQINLEKVKEIGFEAFMGCESLTEVTFGNLETVGYYAFKDCTGLKKVTLPGMLTEMDHNIFVGCTGLEEIYFTGNAPKFHDQSFGGMICKAYYPEDNQTWTEEVMQNYGGEITWEPYEFKHEHTYDDIVDGTCNICGVHRETVEKRKVHHMLRMYNPNTGEHFYTGSEVERDDLIAAGWNYEGVAFTFPANTGAPVYRLFDPVTGEHLYTMDEAEKDLLLSKGWNYEGIAFNSAYDTEAVQHRLYNPNTTVGAYHFTFSEEEMQNLIDAGWWYQGIGWYSCWK